MAAAALKKITGELEKVTKKLEGASRGGKKAKAGEEDLDNKTLTGLVHSLKSAIEQLVTFMGKQFLPQSEAAGDSNQTYGGPH